MPHIKITREREKRKYKHPKEHEPTLCRFFEQFVKVVRRDEGAREETRKVLIDESDVN